MVKKLYCAICGTNYVLFMYKYLCLELLRLGMIYIYSVADYSTTPREKSFNIFPLHSSILWIWVGCLNTVKRRINFFSQGDDIIAFHNYFCNLSDILILLSPFHFIKI